MIPAETGNRIRILIVDDEPDFRNALAFFLKRMSYEILLAASGREAFELIQNNKIDAVISDIRMPDGDGVELLDRVRSQCPHTPIILLVTGFSEFSTEDAYNKGAEAIFSKPFDPRLMRDTIARLLTPPEERWAKTLEQVDVNLRVVLQVQGLNESLEAKAVSLGRGGMFVTLDGDLYPNVNDTASFRIIFDSDGGSLDGSGFIRWVRTSHAPNLPAGFGIEFSFLSEPHKQQIIELIKKNQPIAFIPKH